MSDVTNVWWFDYDHELHSGYPEGYSFQSKCFSEMMQNFSYKEHSSQSPPSLSSISTSSSLNFEPWIKLCTKKLLSSIDEDRRRRERREGNRSQMLLTSFDMQSLRNQLHWREPSESCRRSNQPCWLMELPSGNRGKNSHLPLKNFSVFGTSSSSQWLEPSLPFVHSGELLKENRWWWHDQRHRYHTWISQWIRILQVN